MKPRVSQLAQSGAVTDDALVWDGTEWAPAAVVDAGAVPKSLVDAKGDLLVGTADNTVTRRAVGSDGQVLTADSAETTGVKWASLVSGYSDPLTMKGDLVGRTSSATVRIPVGSNGQLLTADSTDANGVKWAAAPAVPTEASDLTTVIVPVTAVTAGVPDLVWDASFNLVLTEVSYP